MFEERQVLQESHEFIDQDTFAVISTVEQRQTVSLKFLLEQQKNLLVALDEVNAQIEKSRELGCKVEEEIIEEKIEEKSGEEIKSDSSEIVSVEN